MIGFSDSDQWFIAATIAPGIGRSYLIGASTLSEVNPDTMYNAAGSYEAARKWAAEYIKAQANARIYWDTSRPTHFGYVSRKHVEGIGDAA